MSLPENRRKLDASKQLAELASRAGISLIELAIAFVLRHPAVTSAIIGPRTMKHLESQLTAAHVELPEDALNRIDEIVPPGVTAAGHNLLSELRFSEWDASPGRL